jgi:hypothetical protein
LLIENSHFSIAVRTDADKRTLDLIELKESFIKTSKSRVTELDHSNDGLQFLQNCSEIVPYSGEELAQFYSEQVVDLFLHDAIQKKLPKEIRKTFLRLRAAGQAHRAPKGQKLECRS